MKSELLAPAGDFETALAAFAAGADAVYCGLSDFSARAFATNFTLDHLKDLLRVARSRSKRVYVTFNTVIDEANLEEAIDRLSRLEDVGPDAIIVQDLGVARLSRKFFPKLTLHASTQLVAHNLEGVLELKELGFRRVVLARELSLAEISQIAQRCGANRLDPVTGEPEMELEVFIHGALCYSVSGLCLYGAMEKGRSGNRGKCPYCCRQNLAAAGAKQPFYPFSMKDLRLGEDVRKLVDAGVVSLKIEGRMKSPLYVSSVVSWYRGLLDQGPSAVTPSDLETVFSRRTTELLFNGPRPDSSPIDPDSLGHLGTPVGTVKRVTRDREGRSWLRFHTNRALEKHDGLQFDALTDEGRHFGFGISEMRQAISRREVFEVEAGSDVEIALPENAPIRGGDTVYCSMSNAVKRRFPVPSFRRSDFPGFLPVDVEVTIAADGISAAATLDSSPVSVRVEGTFAAAKDPAKTYSSVEKALSKLGDTDYRLGRLTLVDPDRRFAPMSVLNDVRRDLVEALDSERERARLEKVDAAVDSLTELTDFASPSEATPLTKTLKLRPDQPLPAGEWNEIVLAVNAETEVEEVRAFAGTIGAAQLRLSLPVWNAELGFNRLRTRVKAFLREGYSAWEASDLATLRLLRSLGVEDITADWSLYAFNSSALALLAERGVRRFVASPENGRENLAFLAESGYAVELLAQQSTPLFVSLHRPAGLDAETLAAKGLAVFQRDGLWVTTKAVPRSFEVPSGATRRYDLSWGE